MRSPARSRLWIWLLWLGAFYATWLWLAFGLGWWPTAAAHWPMALAMALGSYVAGSTPMGGGSVGFPVLVLLFGEPATLGRDFSFAVQSIGMTSASIFILARRQPLAFAMLKGALCGTLIGTPLGILVVGPLVPELWIKICFAVLWGSFGVLHLYRLGELSAQHGLTSPGEGWDFRVGLVVGAASGASVVAVTGVGIDTILYVALVLLCRADLRIAIPTSVVVMAFTSVLGIGIKLLVADVQAGVFENWLAAAPVVALGAPLGVFVVSLFGRRPTLLVVAVLCVGQFVWACYTERSGLGATGIALAVCALLLVLAWLERLRAWGRALAHAAPDAPPAFIAELDTPHAPVSGAHTGHDTAPRG